MRKGRKVDELEDGIADKEKKQEEEEKEEEEEEEEEEELVQK